MSDKYCPTCDPVLTTMRRIIDAREHDCRVMEGMVKGRDAEIERLRRELAALQDWAHTESLNTVRLNEACKYHADNASKMGRELEATQLDLADAKRLLESEITRHRETGALLIDTQRDLHESKQEVERCSAIE